MALKKIILSLITFLILSTLFFPQNKISFIWIPLLLAGILWIVYLKIK